MHFVTDADGRDATISLIAEFIAAQFADVFYQITLKQPAQTETEFHYN